MDAAMVPMPMVETTASRIPANSAFLASGTWTRISTCMGVMPIPEAASRTEGSTSFSPVMKFLRSRYWL